MLEFQLSVTPFLGMGGFAENIHFVRILGFDIHMHLKTTIENVFFSQKFREISSVFTI